MPARLKALVAVAALLLAGSQPLGAQEFPSKPIKVVTPYTPGTFETIIRAMGIKIAEAGGPPIVIESKTGGRGVPAALAVTQAKPDGYTLFLGDLGTLGLAPAMSKDNPFDPVKDFTPITQLLDFPSVMYMPANRPVKNLKELVEWGKTRRGGLQFASQGVGSGGHILGEMLAKSAGTPMTHVPFRGGTPARMEIIAGRVDFLFGNYSAAVPLVQAGQIKLLGVASPKRLAVAPDLPTVEEQGFPGVDFDVWFGLLAPAGTDKAVVAKLNKMFAEAGKAAEVRKLLDEEGIISKTSTPDEFASLVRNDLDRMKKLVIELKIIQ